MARRPAHVALLGLLAGCAASGPVPSEPSDWSVERDALDRAVDARARWADANPAAWTRSARLAETLAARARHTGDLDDFDAAEDALADAFAHAVEGSGPVLEQARLDLSLHRFDRAIVRAEQALDDVIVASDTRSAALSVIGRSAVELGEVDRARMILEEAHALDPSALTWSNLAVVYRAAGQQARADQAWESSREACGCPGTRFDGWIALQQGLGFLDGGDPAAALPHFEEALRRYSGDWVFQEHLAEALASTGRLHEADALYAEAVATARDPEVLAAWAGVRRQLGHAEHADALIAEARARFTDAMERFPEAASGHAAAFFEEHGE